MLRPRGENNSVVGRLDSAIHWINRYPLDNTIGFASVYPLDSDLSGGWRYPPFEQPRPGSLFLYSQMLFNADIRQNYTLEEVNLNNFHQKFENIKQKFTLILD